MISRFRLSIVALCIAGMLAGCGSVTNGLAFQAPAGWSGTPAMFGRVQAWFKGAKQSDSTQYLVLVKGRSSDTTGGNDLWSVAGTKNVKILSRASMRFCGTQPGEELKGEGTDRRGGKAKVQIDRTTIGENIYVAVYVRSAESAPDREAEAALHSLCPTK